MNLSYYNSHIICCVAKLSFLVLSMDASLTNLFFVFSFSFKQPVNFEITVLIVVTVSDLMFVHATSVPKDWTALEVR